MEQKGGFAVSDLKPGDRALVIRPTECCGNATMVGREINALLIEPAHCRCVYCGWVNAFVARVVFNYEADGRHSSVAAARVIRLPPPDEAKRLFRETEKPVTA